MQTLYDTEDYLIEYFRVEGGLLSIEVKATGESFMVGIHNTLSGRCVVRGQFNSCVKTHGIDRAVSTFRKLQVN